MSEIHQAIINAGNIETTQKRLKVSMPTLERHLAQVSYHKPVNYILLKTMTSQEAEDAFGDNYQTCILAKKTSLDTLTLADIHGTLFKAGSYTAAANQLSIHPDTLYKHIAPLFDKYKDLNYALLKKMPIEEAKATFGDDYNQPLPARIPLDKRTLSEIHQFILDTTTLQAAANRLSVHFHVLQSYIAPLFDKYKNLNYQILKAMSAEQAQDTFGEAYLLSIQKPKRTRNTSSISAKTKVKPSEPMEPSAIPLEATQRTLREGYPSPSSAAEIVREKASSSSNEPISLEELPTPSTPFRANHEYAHPLQEPGPKRRRGDSSSAVAKVKPSDNGSSSRKKFAPPSTNVGQIYSGFFSSLQPQGRAASYSSAVETGVEKTLNYKGGSGFFLPAPKGNIRNDVDNSSDPMLPIVSDDLEQDHPMHFMPKLR